MYLADVDPDEFSKRHRIGAPSGLRRNETIGGGFIVIERTPKKKRLRAAMWPLEVESYAKAAEAVLVLQRRHPDKSFAIFEQVGFSEAKRG